MALGKRNEEKSLYSNDKEFLHFFMFSLISVNAFTSSPSKFPQQRKQKKGCKAFVYE